jgi:hypothetical protein
MVTWPYPKEDETDFICGGKYQHNLRRLNSMLITETFATPSGLLSPFKQY